jgi:hypothetical protein
MDSASVVSPTVTPPKTGSKTTGVACKAPKVARKTNAADVQTLPIIFAASGTFCGYNVFQL